MGLQPVVATPGAREEALQTSASTGMETGPAAHPTPPPPPSRPLDGFGTGTAFRSVKKEAAMGLILLLQAANCSPARPACQVCHLALLMAF